MSLTCSPSRAWRRSCRTRSVASSSSSSTSSHGPFSLSRRSNGAGLSDAIVGHHVEGVVANRECDSSWRNERLWTNRKNRKTARFARELAAVGVGHSDRSRNASSDRCGLDRLGRSQEVVIRGGSCVDLRPWQGW